MENLSQSFLLWADLLVKLEFPGIADLYQHGAFDRITLFGEGHCAGDAIEVLDCGQRVTHAGTIGSDITSDFTAILDRFLDDQHRIPGQCTNIIRHITMLVIVAIDEFLGCTSCTGSCLVRAEELSDTILAAQFHQLG